MIRTIILFVILFLLMISNTKTVVDRPLLRLPTNAE